MKHGCFLLARTKTTCVLDSHCNPDEIQCADGSCVMPWDHYLCPESKECLPSNVMKFRNKIAISKVGSLDKRRMFFQTRCDVMMHVLKDFINLKYSELLTKVINKCNLIWKLIILEETSFNISCIKLP